MATAPPAGTRSSSRQWIGPKLKLHHLARRAFAAFHVKGGARADARPEPASFPADVRIVDPAVHPLRIEAERVWDAKNHPFAVLQEQQPLGFVARVDGHVPAQTEGVELIDPGGWSLSLVNPRVRNREPKHGSSR